MHQRFDLFVATGGLPGKPVLAVDDEGRRAIRAVGLDQFFVALELGLDRERFRRGGEIRRAHAVFRVELGKRGKGRRTDVDLAIHINGAKQVGMGLFNQAKRLRRVETFGKDFPGLEAELRRQQHQFGVGRQALLQVRHHGCHFIAMRAGVGEHLDHLDLVAGGGCLRWLDQEVVLASHPVVLRAGVAADGQAKAGGHDKKGFQHGIVLRSKGARSGDRAVSVRHAEQQRSHLALAVCTSCNPCT